MGVITIDIRKRQLIYEQIIDCVKEQIARGVLRENDYMPSVRSLANELGINPNTIQKSYAELERQGIIQSVAGRGSIVVVGADEVRGMQKDKTVEKIRHIVKEAAFSGMSFEDFAEIAREMFEAELSDKER